MSTGFSAADVAPDWARDRRRLRACPAGAGRASSPPRVLVVDDDATVRELIAAVLTDAGYRVTAAADGRAALDRLRREPCDLILLDLMMPRMNEWSFRAGQRRMDGCSQMPIVLLSAASRRGRASCPAQIGTTVRYETVLDRRNMWTRAALPRNLEHRGRGERWQGIAAAHTTGG